MSTPIKHPVKAIPDGMHSLTPHITCAGAAAAMEFYKKAFNAIEMYRLTGPDGKLMHGSMQIGNSRLMLADDFPQWGGLDPHALKGSPVTIHLQVEDVDAAFAQAVAAGATVSMPVADMFWGDRYGQVIDPFGHRWALATHKEDLTPEEVQAGMMKAIAAAPECKT